jgi:hypothetical protein
MTRQMLCYDVPMSGGAISQLVLPRDLTHAEGSRLQELISTLVAGGTQELAAQVDSTETNPGERNDAKRSD